MSVLLVEDDLHIGQSLMRALTDAGYQVDWVREGTCCSNIRAVVLSSRDDE